MSIKGFVRNKLRVAVNTAFNQDKVTREQGLALHDKLDELAKKDDGNEYAVWEIYTEHSEVAEIIKALGYDAISIEEAGRLTYGVFGQENGTLS